MVVVGHFIILPTVLGELAVLLACDWTGGADGPWRLHVATEVVCWHGEHVHWAAISIAGIVLWGLLVPLFFTLFLCRHRASLSSDRHFKAMVSFVADGYEPRFLYWECIVQLRRLLIILITAWPGLTRPAEAALYQVVGVAAVLAHFSCMPFDNRAGELLDRIELYGLCLFVALVTAVQASFLGSRADAYGLSVTLLSAASVCLASTCLCSARRSLDRFFCCGLAACCTGVLVFCWASGPDHDNGQLVALVLLAGAVIANCAFVVWLAAHILRSSRTALAELIVRARLTEDRERRALRRAAPSEAWQLALNTPHMLADSAPIGSLLPKRPMPDLPGRTCLHRIQGALLQSHAGSTGGMIRFDPRLNELVLGPHPDTYMDDARISAHMRRELASLGPCITDAERQFLAMGLQDALMHILIERDAYMVPCGLLEFLVRLAFCRRQLAREGDLKGHPEGPMSCADVRGLLFDERTFQEGMDAADLQAYLQQIMSMSTKQVEELLVCFMSDRPAERG